MWPDPPPPPPPPQYDNLVEVGGVIGGTKEGDGYLGVEVSATRRLTRFLFLHAAVATASTLDLPGDHYASDKLTDAKIGIELHWCTHRDIWCWLVGADGGWRHDIYGGTNRSSGEAVFRTGMDIAIGLRELRLRPGFEGTTTKTTGATEAVTLGVAWLW